MIVALTWTAVVSASTLTYNVYRSQTSGTDYQLIFTGATTNSYTDGPGGLVNGTTYYYVVTSVTEDGESAFSPEFAAVAPVFPAAPLALAGVVT